MASQILITGATGFIGRQLTRDLAGQGLNVRVLARSKRKAHGLFGDAVEIAVGDLGNADSLARACRGVETIYHVAGSYRFGLRHRRELWRTNVEGTEALLSAAAKAGAEKIVHLSSAGVLAKSDPINDVLLDENDFPQWAPRWSAYKLSKWEAERRVLAWAKRGVPVTIANTTCPIGRGDEMPTPTGRMILDFMQGKFPFYCRTGLNFIAIADLSAGLQQVGAHGRVGERYLLSDANLWLKDFLDLLARETGRSAPRFCLPRPLVQAIGCVGEMADLLLAGPGSARVCLETALQSNRVQFFSNAKARAELDWQPEVPLRKSIREALAWFRQEPEAAVSHAPAASLESHVR